MKKLYHILLLASLLMVGCSKDDDLHFGAPEATGTFIDTRDNKEYRYVTYGGLDWSVENLSYDLGDMALCVVYQSSEYSQNSIYTTKNAAKYGMLYTYSGAQKAVPEGWRVPTDEEWTQLESMNAFMSPQFALLYGGYYNNYNSGSVPAWRFMGSWGYFWTSTNDASKGSEYFFYRKKFHSHNYMTRSSTDPESYFMSVRFVREKK